MHPPGRFFREARRRISLSSPGTHRRPAIISPFVGVQISRGSVEMARLEFKASEGTRKANK